MKRGFTDRHTDRQNITTSYTRSKRAPSQWYQQLLASPWLQSSGGQLRSALCYLCKKKRSNKQQTIANILLDRLLRQQDTNYKNINKCIEINYVFVNNANFQIIEFAAV